MDWLLYEKESIKNGFNIVCGVDEAGRGPLAGPVYAAAVILPVGKIIEGVNDSKKLSEKRREELYDKIIQESLSYSIASANEIEIDELNILNATYLAMKRAVDSLNVKPDIVLIDGNRSPDLGISTKTIVKGDSLSMSIASASILAKVSRDRYMKNLSHKYPQYQFEKHKGYGTVVHREAIKKYGPCEIHRVSFLKNIIGDINAKKK